ncbi:hypothetical protein B0J11DRAFT_585924 [Dendryphion nanum]|uniref:J domain-containing protein n=1 Tax=Dendryphion nanum TaxID=256645 RepID=A0A9P9I935_9PLEO|nr:hypothetical protein B0J11DRAFT_585924 [Dendryphion nanum]
MSGTSYGAFTSVNIFCLLALNPHQLLDCSTETALAKFRIAYRKAMLRLHTDKTRNKNPEPAQQLNSFKDFLDNFSLENGFVPDRIADLVWRGCQDQHLMSCRLETPVVRQKPSQPGSSPSNPIILDAPELKTSSPNQGRFGNKRKFKSRRDFVFINGNARRVQTTVYFLHVSAK